MIFPSLVFDIADGRYRGGEKVKEGFTGDFSGDRSFRSMRGFLLLECHFLEGSIVWEVWTSILMMVSRKTSSE